MATAFDDPDREIICPSCGRVRLVSGRTARRGPSTCRLCRNPPRHEPPSDSDRRYWLKLFSDDEIAALATAIWDTPGSVEAVHIWRMILIKEERKVMVPA